MSSRFRIVGIGELLWDLFPDGPRFGGAPANYSCHAAALGADVSLVGCIGNDDLGQQALRELREHKVKVDHIGTSEAAPTGVVQVTLDAAGKPHFEIAPHSAWDHMSWSDRFLPLATAADAVCFGTLGQRSATSRETIQRFVNSTGPQALRIFDINLRKPYFEEGSIRQSLELANILKLNDDELPFVAKLFDISGGEVESLQKLQAACGLKVVALTRGARGAVLVRGDEVSEFPGVPATVKDTVGAGDSFTAAMTLGLLRGDRLEEINRHACQIAAYVCSCAGATPALPPQLTSLFSA